MKLIIAVTLAALLAPALPVRAEDKPSALGSFWNNLKLSLGSSAVSGERKKATRGGAKAVAAVRGKEQASDVGDPNEVGLKGHKGAKKAAKELELENELSKLVDLAQTKPADALAGFEAFKKANPKTRVEDVDQAIAVLRKQLGAEAPVEAAAPAPAPAADEKAKN